LVNNANYLPQETAHQTSQPVDTGVTASEERIVADYIGDISVTNEITSSVPNPVNFELAHHYSLCDYVYF